EFDGPQEVWELYDVRTDFSQSVDLADQHPEILAELQRIFHEEAQRHGVYPLRDVASPRHGDHSVPAPLGGLARMTYTTAHVRMPESSVVNLKNCSWRITAEIATAEGDEGVVVCQGGNMAGWSLYLDAGRPTYLYNLYGHDLTSIAAPSALASGAHVIEVLFDSDGGFGAGGTAVLSVDGTAVAEGRVDRTVPLVFSMSGETFDVGIDTGAPVGPYAHGSRCTAEIHGVTLERLSEPGAAVEAAVRAGLLHAGLRTQ
ncbi:MAG: arylsulfatase, partial [Actinomycetota bacterium]